MSKNKNELATPNETPDAAAAVEEKAGAATFETTGLDLLGGDSAEAVAELTSTVATSTLEAEPSAPEAASEANRPEPDSTPAPVVDPLTAVREELVEVEGRIRLLGDPNALLAGLEQRRHDMIKAHAAAEEAYQLAMGELMGAREKAMKDRQWALEDLRLLNLKADELRSKLPA